MRASLLVAVLTLPAAAADPPQFPYEAVIQSGGVTVRSGPGERYDPTLTLNTADRVTVHRHDPGGWYMIAPPPGSFSWIDASHVQKQGDRGVVTIAPQGGGPPPRVVVWIGSAFTTEHKYFGRQLANGDTVEIIGEQTLPTDRGPVLYYKIKPPRLEWRWVKGDAVVPLSEAGAIAQSPGLPRLPGAGVPESSGSGETAPQPLEAPAVEDASLSQLWAEREDSTTSIKSRELSRTIDDSLPKLPETGAAAGESLGKLHALDERFRTMVAQAPGAWDLDGLQQAYQELKAAAPADLAGQIDGRLRAIESRRRVKEEYDAFVRLTTETDRRDAHLRSLLHPAARTASSPTQVDLGPPGPFPEHMVGRAPAPAPATLSGEGAITSLPNDPTASDAHAAPASPSLDGAGIVQRIAGAGPGAPQHALVSPDGRLLAYLHSGPGIELDACLGREMGLIGRRSHDPRLGADLIVVERLVPVRLGPR